MRTLQTNPRNYQEPFQLLILDAKAVADGMDNFKILKRQTLFGSIMNRNINYSQSNFDDQNATLSIKIVSQGFDIKPNDRIRYNGNQYIITSVDRDYYSKKEIVILCHFEREWGIGNSSILNFALNSKVGS